MGGGEIDLDHTANTNIWSKTFLLSSYDGISTNFVPHNSSDIQPKICFDTTGDFFIIETNNAYGKYFYTGSRILFVAFGTTINDNIVFTNIFNFISPNDGYYEDFNTLSWNFLSTNITNNLTSPWLDMYKATNFDTCLYLLINENNYNYEIVSSLRNFSNYSDLNNCKTIFPTFKIYSKGDNYGNTPFEVKLLSNNRIIFPNNFSSTYIMPKFITFKGMNSGPFDLISFVGDCSAIYDTILNPSLMIIERINATNECNILNPSTGDYGIITIGSNDQVNGVDIVDNATFHACYTEVDPDLPKTTLFFKNDSTNVSNYTIDKFRYDSANNLVDSLFISSGTHISTTATIYTKKCSPDEYFADPFTVTNNDNNTQLTVNNTSELTLNGASTNSTTINCINTTSQSITNNKNSGDTTINMNKDAQTLTLSGTGDTDVNCNALTPTVFNNSLGETSINMIDGQDLILGGTASKENIKIGENDSIELKHSTNDRELVINPDSNDTLDLILNSDKASKLSKGSHEAIETLNVSFKQASMIEFFDFFPTTKLTLANAGNDGENIKTRLSDLGAGTGTFNFGTGGVFLSKINLLLNYNDANTKTLAFDTFPANGIFIMNEANGDKTITIDVPSGSYAVTKAGDTMYYAIAASPVVTDYTFQANDYILIQYGVEPKPVPKPTPKPATLPTIGEDFLQGTPSILEPTINGIIDSFSSEQSAIFKSLPNTVQDILKGDINTLEIFTTMPSVNLNVFGGLSYGAQMLIVGNYETIKVFAYLRAENLDELSKFTDMVQEVICSDDSLLGAFDQLSVAQLTDFKNEIAKEMANFINFTKEQRVEFIKNLFESLLGTTIEINAMSNKKILNKKGLNYQTLSERTIFKDKIQGILNQFTPYYLSKYNNLNVDIRKLFYMNGMTLIKFQTLSNQEVYKFAKMSPMGQLDYTLTNFPITYIKRDMRPIVEQRMNILGIDKDFKVQNLKNQINQLEEQGVQIKGANLNQLNTQKTKEQNYSSQKKRLNFIFLK